MYIAEYIGSIIIGFLNNTIIIIQIMIMSVKTIKEIGILKFLF